MAQKRSARLAFFMIQTNELFFPLTFFASLLGFVVAAILLFVNKNLTLAPRLLAIYILLFSVTILHTGLSFTEFYLHYPHFWRSTAWTTFTAPVVAYLYVRSVLYQSFRLKKTDWLLFIPAVLYSINLLPYYLSPASEKLVVVSHFMADKSLIAKEPEGMLPLGWGVMSRFVLGLSLLIAQFLMLAKMRRRIFQTGHTLKQNQITYRWLFLFTSVLFVFYIVITCEHVFHLSHKIDLSTLIFFTMTCTIFFISVYLMVRPNILYGFQGWLHGNPENVQTPELSRPIEAPPDEKRPYLTAEQGRTYRLMIEKHLVTNKPFLKSGYKVQDLSEELQIPFYQVSAFINQEYGKNFNELINGYRILYIESLLKSSPEYSQFTLEAIAREAGFNSRTGFFTAVKKQTGKSPSEYFASGEQVITG